MKTLIAVTFVAALGFAASAQAMPVSQAPADGLITQVRDGCGPGRAKGDDGKCHFRKFWKCGPGEHRGRWGKCRKD
jgi:uncharacterized low-complexity protein